MSKDELEMHIQKNVHMNKAKEMIERAVADQQSIEVSGIFNAFVYCSLT